MNKYVVLALIVGMANGFGFTSLYLNNKHMKSLKAWEETLDILDNCQANSIVINKHWMKTLDMTDECQKMYVKELNKRQDCESEKKDRARESN